MFPWRNWSYEVLPALSVRRKELRHSLRIVTVAWMYGVVWFACVNGEQLRAFVRMLGFNDFAFGVLGAVPFLASVGQLAAAITIERTGLRKYHFVVYATLHRLLWFGVAAVPLVLSPGPVAVVMVLVLLAASNYLGAVSVPSWTTWMGDLIPRRIRGRYFARRAQWSQAVMIVAVIAISIALDKVAVRNSPEAMSSQPVLMRLICGVFAVGAVFGVIDILTFLRVREVVPPHRAGREPQHRTARSWLRRLAGGVRAVRELLLDPLLDKGFRHYVGFGATLTFTAVVSGWYFWRYSTEGLGFSKLGTNALFLVIGPLAGTVTAGLWGRLQDRWGRRPVLIVCTVGATVAMLPWFFTSRDIATPACMVHGINALCGAAGQLSGRGDWHWVTSRTPVVSYLLASLAVILGGSSWTGIGLAQTGIILGFCDGPRRNQYVAVSAVLVNMGGAIGGLTGGIITQSLGYFQTHPLHVGPFAYNNWHATFAVGTVVRALSMLWLTRMPDAGASSVRDMLRYYMSAPYSGWQMWLWSPLRLLLGRGRRGAGPTDPGGRE